MYFVPFSHIRGIFARLDCAKSFAIRRIYNEKIDLNSPSGLVNSLKVGKEMKVWDTECVGFKTQATSLG